MEQIDTPEQNSEHVEPIPANIHDEIYRRINEPYIEHLKHKPPPLLTLDIVQFILFKHREECKYRHCEQQTIIINVDWIREMVIKLQADIQQNTDDIHKSVETFKQIIDEFDKLDVSKFDHDKDIIIHPHEPFGSVHSRLRPLINELFDHFQKEHEKQRDAQKQ